MNPPAPQPTNVEFSPMPPAKLAVNASTTVYAVAAYPLNSVSNTNTLVTYSLSCGSPGNCGVFSASDEAGAIVYTAPAAVPVGGTVTITANSAADTSITTSAIIAITPPVPISVSIFNAAPASLVQGATTYLSALISNDVSSNPQVKWSVTCPAADCGSFNPTQTGSESPTAYTAPAGIPSGGSVKVTATSVTDATKAASVSIVILPPASQLADGTYVFQIAGINSIGNTFTTGAFIAAGGAIVSGEQDTIDSDDFSSFSPITGGTYAPMPDGNLQISLDVPSINNNLPEVLTGTMTSGAHGFVAGVEGIVGTGTLDLQTSTAAPAGGYAILLSGGSFYDPAILMGGILNIDGPDQSPAKAASSMPRGTTDPLWCR